MAGVATVIRRSEITVLALNLEEEQWSQALARMFMLVKPSGLDCCCFPTLVDLASASFVEHCPIKRIKPVRAAKMSGASAPAAHSKSALRQSGILRQTSSLDGACCAG